jgi:hippurate hydrolase
MDAVFGLHNWPGIPVGEMAVVPGPVMAGTCCFEIVVRGEGCHAGMPHQGTDSLVVASHLVLALQTIASREIHPCESAVVSVTQIHGGDALNVIPEEAVLRGTIRSFKPEIQHYIEESISRLCTGIGHTYGASISVRFDQRYPPTVNHPAETAQCQQVAEQVVGADKVRTDDLPSMGAEDFAYMLREIPGCYVWLGNGSAADAGVGACSLHNPHYDFNDQIIPLGVAYWVRLAQHQLGDKD